MGVRLKWLLIDDHALFREGLVLILKTALEGVDLIQAGSLAQGMAALRAHAGIDLILLDLGLPDAAGLLSVHDLREKWPDLPLVIVSGDDGPALVNSCVAAGAMGFISKTSDSRTMIAALRGVMAGEVVLPATVDGLQARRTDAVSGLTPRQREVLARLVQGKTNKAIGAELGINEHTVKSHVAVVLQTLGVANRTEAVFAVRHLRLR